MFTKAEAKERARLRNKRYRKTHKKEVIAFARKRYEKEYSSPYKEAGIKPIFASGGRPVVSKARVKRIQHNNERAEKEKEV